MTALTANVPFGMYLAALLVFGVSYVVSSASWKKWGEILLGAGWVVQTALMIWRWQVGGRPPMANQYESLLVLSWGVILIYGCLRWSTTISGLGFWVAACSLLILASASLFDHSIQPLMPALQSNWLLYHVIVIMVGYAALALAAVMAGVYLVCYRNANLKEEKAKALDALMFRAVTLGFLFLVGGIILGSVWANEAWGSYWSWDPKETWSLITWMYYAVAIHLRRTRGWMGARFAWLVLVGLAFVIFTYFGVNFLLVGLHSYA